RTTRNPSSASASAGSAMSNPKPQDQFHLSETRGTVIASTFASRATKLTRPLSGAGILRSHSRNRSLCGASVILLSGLREDLDKLWLADCARYEGRNRARVFTSCLPDRFPNSQSASL